MRFFAAVAACLLATPALAYELHNMSSQDVLLIGEALDAMPHGKVADLYNRIQHQLSAEDLAAVTDARIKIEKEIRDKISSESKKDKPNE